MTLSGGGYTSAATTLSGGSATINIPANSLSAGTDSLTVSYTPDSSSSSTYNSATGTNSVTVTQAKTTPTVTVTPSASSITTAQALSVTVTVAGSSDAYRLGDTERRRVHLGSYNTEQRKRHDQHPRRIAQHWQRHTHRQLHSGLQQFLNL